MLCYKCATLLKNAMSFFGQSVLQTSETVRFPVNGCAFYSNLQNKWYVFKKKRQEYNMRSCDVPQNQKGAIIFSRQFQRVAAVYHSLKIFCQIQQKKSVFLQFDNLTRHCTTATSLFTWSISSVLQYNSWCIFDVWPNYGG